MSGARDPVDRQVTGEAKPAIGLSDWMGDGPPLLLVHGFSHNRAVWSDIANGLASCCRPIALDLRGHGDSGWCPSARYAPEDLADDLARVLDSLGIEQTIIVGHSLGGNAVTLFAGAHPDRVAGVALVDTGPALKLGGMEFVTRDVSESFKSYATREEFLELLRATHRQAPDATLERLAYSALAERVDGRFEPKLDPGYLAGADTVSWKELEARLWASLRRLECPVLVVRGGLSAMLAADVAEAMVDSVPGDAELVTIERAGHAVMLDAGEELLSILGEWMPRAVAHGKRLTLA